MSASKVGRPAVGRNINVRLPQDLLQWVDQLAETRKQTRAEAIRVCIARVRAVGLAFDQAEARERAAEEARVRDALTVKPTELPPPLWAMKVPEGLSPRQTLGRVMTLWGERHTEPRDYHGAEYVRGIAEFRLGYRANGPRGSHLDKVERRQIRELVDGILAEVLR